MLIGIGENIEKKLVGKEITLCAFIDIEGSFDKTSHIFLTISMEARNLHTSLIW